MSSYAVWCPQLVEADPPTVSLFVTLAEHGRPGRGTVAFVAQLLRDAQVDAPTIVRWTMQRYRTAYFTEYPEPDEDWQDRWQLAWRVRAELAGAPTLCGDSIDGQYPSDAVDASAPARGDVPPVLDAPCLVLADFDDRESADIAREMIAPAAEIGRAMDQFWQLQIDLGPRDEVFYAAGASEAADTMRACRDLGASVHYQQSLRRKLQRP